MKQFFKIFLLLGLFFTTSYSCSLCKVTIPKVNVKAYIIANEINTTFDITWKFSKEYMKTLLMYDINENGKLDENEQKEIQDTLIEYIKELNYITNIIYNKKDINFILNNTHTINISKQNFLFKEGEMYYNYIFDLNFKIEKDNKLYISFYDLYGNFVFNLDDILLKNYNGVSIISPYSSYSYYYFYQKDITKLETKPILIKEKKEIIDTHKIIEEPKDENNNKDFTDILSSKLEEIKVSIEELLNDIKENNSIGSYIWLLLFSFLYGIVHAMGPGHGKSLISAYFMAEDRNYIKAINMSLLIGIVHTFSAFILTLVIYYILGVMFANTGTDIEQIATKISAIIIISIALYMIYKKLPKKDKISHKSSCSCSGCKTHSTDAGVILAAGIIPCPGTVTIFIFTMSLGIYFVGFLSAIFMSLGMSLIIFISAFLTIKIKQQTNTNNNIKKIFEYGSLLFILFLGIILLV